MPEPPPVRVTAIQDVCLPTLPDRHRALDQFYVDLLKFERENPQAPGAAETRVYRAENVRVQFQIRPFPAERDHLRTLEIEIPSLGDLETQLMDRRMEYTRVRAVGGGRDGLLLQDPAGNWVHLVEKALIT